MFAADGGDILVWSTRGDIDAGRGAKTAISAPPPTITFDENGRPHGESSRRRSPAAASRRWRHPPGREPGDVDLFAPRGVVNAGDAGIVAGNLTIARDRGVRRQQHPGQRRLGGRAGGYRWPRRGLRGREQRREQRAMRGGAGRRGAGRAGGTTAPLASRPRSAGSRCSSKVSAKKCARPTMPSASRGSAASESSRQHNT